MSTLSTVVGDIALLLISWDFLLKCEDFSSFVDSFLADLDLSSSSRHSIESDVCLFISLLIVGFDCPSPQNILNALALFRGCCSWRISILWRGTSCESKDLSVACCLGSCCLDLSRLSDESLINWLRCAYLDRVYGDFLFINKFYMESCDEWTPIFCCDNLELWLLLDTRV